MKNYKNFLKINESSEYSEFDYDENIIGEYYDSNYKWSDYHTEDEIGMYFTWYTIESKIDIERLTDDYKSDFVSYNEIESYDSYYNEYILENISTFNDDISEKFKEEILDDLDEEDEEDYVDYTPEDKLDDLDDDMKMQMILDNDDSDFLSYVWEKIYPNNALEYIYEIYGEPTYSNDIERNYNIIQELVKTLINYINITDFDIDNDDDYEYKESYFYETLSENTETAIKHQKDLIDYNNDNIIPLFDTCDNFSNTKYIESEKFQQIYIDKKLEQEKEYWDTTEKLMKEEMPDILISFNNIGILNYEIEKKYNKYMYKIRVKEFNI